jgi:hypothetical protein
MTPIGWQSAAAARWIDEDGRWLMVEMICAPANTHHPPIASLIRAAVNGKSYVADPSSLALASAVPEGRCAVWATPRQTSSLGRSMIWTSSDSEPTACEGV